jgi:transcriptional regulator with XRE-family HTH domain
VRIEEIVGRRVRDIRERKDMTQADLGRAVGPFLGRPWSRQTMSFAEQGRRAFTAAELVVLAHVLNTNIAMLFVPPAGDDDDLELPGGTLTRKELTKAALEVQGDLDTMIDMAAVAQLQRIGANLLSEAQARGEMLRSASWSSTEEEDDKS